MAGLCTIGLSTLDHNNYGKIGKYTNHWKTLDKTA